MDAPKTLGVILPCVNSTSQSNDAVAQITEVVETAVENQHLCMWLSGMTSCVLLFVTGTLLALSNSLSTRTPRPNQDKHKFTTSETHQSTKPLSFCFPASCPKHSAEYWFEVCCGEHWRGVGGVEKEVEVPPNPQPHLLYPSHLIPFHRILIGEFLVWFLDLWMRGVCVRACVCVRVCVCWCVCAWWGGWQAKKNNGGFVRGYRCDRIVEGEAGGGSAGLSEA